MKCKVFTSLQKHKRVKSLEDDKDRLQDPISLFKKLLELGLLMWMNVREGELLQKIGWSRQFRSQVQQGITSKPTFNMLINGSTALGTEMAKDKFY